MTDSVTPICSRYEEAIAQTIDRLRYLTQKDIQASWQMHLGNRAVPPQPGQAGQVAPLNSRHHIAWGKGQQVLWLSQELTIPTDLQGYPLQGLALRLALTWWAEAAQIFVNGILVQAGDLFDCSTRVLLSPAAQPGETVQIALRLVSPGHDDGALVRSHCVYEVPDCQLQPEPGFVADELAVLQHYLSQFAPEKLLDLATALGQIQWSALPDRAAFDRALSTLRQQLQPLGDWVKQRQIRLLGHAHLDLAWLWTVEQTWQAAERTFQSVLQLQQDFPELIFCHSTPALYAWMEVHRPDLFAAIQAQIATGRWEVVAGLWVEPELNLVSGESIARQVLYGQRYVQQRFGKLSLIAWLPDSFGFCWQLPQILKQGGVEYFVTQKLRWNDTTEFPYEWFWWRSPDGTSLLSFNSPPIGEGIDPVKISRYACSWEAKTHLPNALWLPGVGDHGGGPTRDMLETARRWQQSPFFPRLEFGTAANYLHQFQPLQGEADTLPVWDDELYLEFHRGCYTTHADQKRSNRRCEQWLYQAELWSAIATLTTAAPYPQALLETTWKQVLFNQFHDILPGSAIPAVFVEANQTWQAAEQAAQQLVNQAWQAIAAHITLPSCPAAAAQPFLVCNALNWQRSELVLLTLPAAPDQHWQVWDAEGRSLPTQLDAAGNRLLFLANDIPSVGYRMFWLSASPKSALTETPEVFGADNHPQDNDWTLENAVLRASVDPLTGNLASVVDKVRQQEILSAPGNQLQAFQDSGQYWDAWNIDPAYAQHPLPTAKLLSIDWIDRGTLQQRLRIVRQIGQSEFQQDYVLDVGSALLKIVTQVDWQERHTLVKAAFPLNLYADRASYEIPFGAIDRPTQPSTPAEQAKWEVPALQWADLSQDEFGVSLLNDCKYGYDSQPSQLRLTLLRGSTWPNPDADRGHHEFTYALYPHGGSWQTGETDRRGYELNNPLQVVQTAIGTAVSPRLPASGEFLNLNAENLIISAFKRSEDHPNQWILRCYESHGQPGKLYLTGDLIDDLALKPTQVLDLLERPLQPEVELMAPETDISPWRITTLALSSIASI